MIRLRLRPLRPGSPPYEPGRYLKVDTTQRQQRPSTVECPFCHDRLQECLNRPMAVIRADRQGAMYGDIIPPSYSIFWCKSCDLHLTTSTEGGSK